MTFKFYLGGYSRDNYHCQLKNGHLHCSEYDYAPFLAEEKVVNLTGNKDWELLLEFVKTCNWNKTYDIGACDGTQWELKADSKIF